MATSGPVTGRGMVLGVLTGAVVVLASFAGMAFARLPNVPYDVFEAVTRHLPGRVVTLGIDLMVRVIDVLGLGPTAAAAKTAEKALAVTSFLLLGLVFGGMLGRWFARTALPVGLLGGLVLAGAAIVVEAVMGFRSGAFLSVSWCLVLMISWGGALGASVRGVTMSRLSEKGEPVPRRRQVLRALLGTAVVALLAGATGLGLWRRARRMRRTGTMARAPRAGAPMGPTSGPAASPPAAVLAARIHAAPGTRPELTTNADFYRIDINLDPPQVDAASWTLELGGLVQRPLSLSLEGLQARPSQSQVVTLECISNPVGGDLISTTRFTGVPLRELLTDAGLRPEVRGIAIEAVDGFHEAVPLDEAMDARTLLAYAMNGEPLPVAHGFPLRIIIPGHFGMKQPKWIVRMRAVAELPSGYWVQRGWSQKAVVRTTSVIDVVGRPEQREAGLMVAVGGIAFAGDRGISSVEVQVDDGPWSPASLRLPALSPLAWVQWRYDWPYQSGEHTFRVRARDGAGDLQDAIPRPPHPDGATGWHEMTVRV